MADEGLAPAEGREALTAPPPAMATAAATAPVTDDGGGPRPLGHLARTAVLVLGLTAFAFGMLGTLSGAAALMWLVPRLAGGAWTVGLGAGAWYVGSVGLLVAGGCVWFSAIRARAPARGALVAATIGAGLASFPGLVWLAFVARHLLRGQSLPTGGAPGGLHDTLSFALPVLLAAAHGAALLALGRRLPRFAPGSARRIAAAWGGVGAVVIAFFGYVGFPRILHPVPSAPTAEECNTILLDENGLAGRWCDLISEWKEGLVTVAPEAFAIRLQRWASWGALRHRAMAGEGHAAIVPGLIASLRPSILGLPRLDMAKDRGLSAIHLAGPAGRAAIPVLVDLLESQDGWAHQYLLTIAELGLDPSDPVSGRCVEVVRRLAESAPWQLRLQAMSTLVRIAPPADATRAREALLVHAMDPDDRGLRHGWAMDYLLATCRGEPWLIDHLVRLADAHLAAARPFPLIGGRPCGPAPGVGAPCLTHLWTALQQRAANPLVAEFLSRALSCPHPGARACAALILGRANCATPELERALDRALEDADPVCPSFAAVAFLEQHVCAPGCRPSILIALARMVATPVEPADGVVQALRTEVAAEAGRVDGIGRHAQDGLASDDGPTRSAAFRVMGWAIRTQRNLGVAEASGDRDALVQQLWTLHESGVPEVVTQARDALLDLGLVASTTRDAHVSALEFLVGRGEPHRDLLVLSRLIAALDINADEAYPAGFSLGWGCGVPPPAGKPCLRCLWNVLERAGAHPSLADFYARALDSPLVSVRARAAEALAELNGATPELARGLDRALAGPDAVAQVFAASRLVFRERVGPERTASVVRALARLADPPEAGPKLLDSMRTAVRLKEKVMARIGALTRECLESPDAPTQAAAKVLAAWLWASDAPPPPAEPAPGGPR